MRRAKPLSKRHNEYSETSHPIIDFNMHGSNSLTALEAVARPAGCCALSHFREAIRVAIKPAGPRLSTAARDAAAAVRRWIEKRVPTAAILGKEMAAKTKPSPRRWIIAPI